VKNSFNEIITNILKVESDLKVVGRIDLTSLNQRTRPPKKSKKQKKKNAEQEIIRKADAPATATNTPNQQDLKGRSSTDSLNLNRQNREMTDRQDWMMLQGRRKEKEFRKSA
jgi:translation initiation factor IF-2